MQILKVQNHLNYRLLWIKKSTYITKRRTKKDYQMIAFSWFYNNTIISLFF